MTSACTFSMAVDVVPMQDETTAITKRDHTPQQLLVTKHINVTGMQNKRQKRA